MLAATLVSSGLVRLLGALVFLELFVRKRESRHLLLFLGWSTYSVGPLAASSLGVGTPVFGASAVGGTLILLAGALAYFRKVSVARILVLAGLLAALTTTTSILWPSTQLLSTAAAQGIALAVAAAATLLARQEFVGVAPGSYIWLVTITAIGTAHAIGFATVYRNNDAAIPYVATLLLAVATIIFFLHMESEVSASDLARSEMRYRGVFEQAATGIAEVDLDGVVVSCNATLADSLGYSQKDIVGTPAIDLVEESARERFLNKLAELRASQHSQASFESSFTRGDGSLMWGGVSLSLSYDFQGRPSSYLAFVKDISSRKQMEAELARHKDDLEGIVSDRTRELAEANRVLTKLNEELEDANAKLDHANNVKSEFLAKMSHELRTPLNSVIGFSGVLKRGMAGPLTEEQEKQLSFVHNAGSHLLDLVNDVLDLSKIEAQEMTPEYERFDLWKLVDELADVIERAAGEKHLDLKRVYDCTECMITSDRRFVYQIAANLTWNAVKFTHKGGVTITLRADDKVATLEVADTGVGIAENNLEHVFEPFLQLTVDRTYNEPGSGLGLSISRQLATLLGGDLSAESTLGEGSTFTLTLPVDAPER